MTRKFIPVEESFQAWRKDPDYVAAYDALEDEFTLAGVTKKQSSEAIASIHETAEGLHAARVMDKQTMRKFDEAGLTPVGPLTAAEIQAPRQREGSRDRRVVRSGELSDAEIALITKAEVPAKHAHLDEELDD